MCVFGSSLFVILFPRSEVGALIIALVFAVLASLFRLREKRADGLRSFVDVHTNPKYVSAVRVRWRVGGGGVQRFFAFFVHEDTSVWNKILGYWILQDLGPSSIPSVR